MADRALRGMTIGAKSMESEDGVEFAERMIVSYEWRGLPRAGQRLKKPSGALRSR